MPNGPRKHAVTSQFHWYRVYPSSELHKSYNPKFDKKSH